MLMNEDYFEFLNIVRRERALTLGSELRAVERITAS